ncbi:hypothetical protein JB92DRAFT_2857329 [Gautieria morchelliformis]|nr:hypothetical protein JB92DRAFT_2857329 [Gautieria morchelliformis]
MTSQGSSFRVSQYAPANETEADLMYERLNIDGAVLGGVAYGVHATLFFMCLSLLLKLRKKDPKSSWAFIAYITLNFVLGSIGNGANTRFNEMTFVDDRDYPSGPNAFYIQQNSFWVNIFGFGVYIVNMWTQDGLLLYRFLVIFGLNYWVVVIPSMLYLASIVMSCLLLARIAKPSTTVYSHVSVNFFLTFTSVSIGTTLLVTILIVSRLLVMRYKLHKVVGPGEARDSPYVSISAMFIESACLYSAVALIFIITYAKNDPAQNLVLPVLGQVQSVSPLLIILRVVQGRAWGKDTLRSTNLDPATKMNFHDPSSTGSGAALSGLQSKVDGRSSRSASPTFGYPGEV